MLWKHWNDCVFNGAEPQLWPLGYAGARGLAHLDIWFRVVCVLGRYLPFMRGANVNYSLCGVCRGCSHFLFLNAITQLSCAFEGGKGSYCIAMAHSPWAVLIPSNLGLLFSDGNIRSWQSITWKGNMVNKREYRLELRLSNFYKIKRAYLHVKDK